MSDIKFCCDRLQEAFEQRGKAGLSCVVDKYVEGFFTKLQIRGCSKDDAEQLKATAIDNLPVKIRTVEEQGFKFCPWCGVDMNNWLNENTPTAEKLYASSKDFIESIV